MRISIFAVGRLKRGSEEALCSRYLDRFAKAGPPLGLTFTGLTEIAESKASRPELRQQEEADRLKARFDNSQTLILLDETGKNVTSREFAGFVRSMRDDGVRDCWFAIGGPDGHDASLHSLAGQKISFGKLTWPHQIARIMLAEQLYRATTILSGHPYHRD